MKKRTRLFGMLLTVCILMSNVTTVFAAGGENAGIMPHWTDVSTISSRMEVDKWGIATISASGQSSITSSADSVELIVDLQRYKDGKWETIKTWSDKPEATFAAVYERYAIAKGYSYRLYLTVKAYQGNKLLETATDIYSYGAYN